MSGKIHHTFAFQDLHHAEAFQFHNEILAQIEKHTAAALDLTALAPVYTVAVGELDEATKIIRKSEHTAPLAETHKARRSALHGLKLTVQGLAHHHTAEKREAGRLLSIPFDAYKDILRKNREETTADIHNLLADLATPKYATLMTENGLTAWANAVGSLNNQYSNLLKLRDAEIGAIPKDAADIARAKADAVYGLIIGRVNSLFFEGATVSAAVVAFVDTVNNIIKRFAVLAKKGHHKPHKDEGGDTESEAGEEDIESPED